MFLGEFFEPFACVAADRAAVVFDDAPFIWDSFLLGYIDYREQ